MFNAEHNSALHNSKLAKFLNEEELRLFLAFSKSVVFSAGEKILKQGTPAEGIYLIIDGTATVTAKLLGEGITDIETVSPGNFLGEISFIEKVPSATTVIAVSSVKCILITPIYFDMLTVYFPETKYKILEMISKQVCGKLKRMHDKITALIGSSDMAAQSYFFGRMIESLTKPENITLKECGIDMSQLQKSSLFKSFSSDEIDELLKHTNFLKAPNHCKLIHEGEERASCYIVIHGAVQSSLVKDNKTAKLSVIGPQTLFAGTACVDSDPSYTITFVTCERAILFRYSEADLDFFKKNSPQLWYKIFSLICRSLVVLEKSFDKLDIRLNIEMYNKVR